MYICPMDRDFQWIRKVIGSITHFGQIQSAENLIDFYVKKYEDSEWLDKERKRNRERYHRLDYKTKWKPTTEIKKETIKKYRN